MIYLLHRIDQYRLDSERVFRYSNLDMTEIAHVDYGESKSLIVLVSREEILPEKAELSIFDGNTILLFPDKDSERTLVLPPGEAAKNWTSIERIINRAMALAMGRDGLIVGIGGGVVIDTTAFAASLYMRGCRLILVPTTLLAMVDASIGGKTGIDFSGIKNLVGTYYPAEEIRICPALLDTLSDREYLSGLAEVIKHAMLNPGSEGGLWDTLKNKREKILARDKNVLEHLIIDALMVKIGIVTQDMKESGPRSFLNLGHTFAHALESATHFSRWSHGEAVAWGIVRALEMGEQLDITDKTWGNECKQLIADYGFDSVVPRIPLDELKKAMNVDKKKKGGKIRFVMMRGPGEPVLQEVPWKAVDSVLGKG